MTPQEVKLWVHPRSWRKRGHHCRRQAPRNDFIVDFVCIRRKLIVEFDGGQHNFELHQLRDRARDAKLNVDGFRVLRFWNNEVDGNLVGVLEAIDIALKEDPHPAGYAGHPPPAGKE